MHNDVSLRVQTKVCQQRAGGRSRLRSGQGGRGLSVKRERNEVVERRCFLNQRTYIPRSSRLIHVIFLIACLFTGDPCPATTIVILYRPTSIVVAADTLGVLHGQIAGRQEFHHCKIKSSGSFFFTSTGYNADEAVGFDAAKTTTGILQSPLEAFSQKVDKISREIPAKLLAGIQFQRRSLSSEEYTQSIRITRDVLTIAVFGVEHQATKMALIAFGEADDSKGNPIAVNPRITYCPGQACGSGGFFLGYNQAALRQTEDRAHPFWTGNDAKDARRIVEIEIADVPTDVGGPVDVLLINAEGSHRWVPPYGECRP